MNTFSQIIIYAIITLYTLAALTTITTVGKPRKPTSPEAAAAGTFVATSVIVGLLFVLWSNR